MTKLRFRPDPSKKDFSPPTLIEKFQQPIIKSEPFTGFEVEFIVIKHQTLLLVEV